MKITGNSNSGYVVLGAVIEKITGKSYEDNLRERIGLTLGLKNIYYSKSEKEIQKDRAFELLLILNGLKKVSITFQTAPPPEEFTALSKTCLNLLKQNEILNSP